MSACRERERVCAYVYLLTKLILLLLVTDQLLQSFVEISSLAILLRYSNGQRRQLLVIGIRSTHDDNVQKIERLQLSIGVCSVVFHFILLALRSTVVFVLERTTRTRRLFSQQYALIAATLC